MCLEDRVHQGSRVRVNWSSQVSSKQQVLPPHWVDTKSLPRVSSHWSLGQPRICTCKDESWAPAKSVPIVGPPAENKFPQISPNPKSPKSKSKNNARVSMPGMPEYARVSFARGARPEMKIFHLQYRHYTTIHSTAASTSTTTTAAGHGDVVE